MLRFFLVFGGGGTNHVIKTTREISSIYKAVECKQIINLHQEYFAFL